MDMDMDRDMDMHMDMHMHTPAERSVLLTILSTRRTCSAATCVVR